MATEWTVQDEQQWDALNAKSYAERSVDEEMRLKHLEAKRNLAVMGHQEKVRKSGLLYKPAIACFVLGLGSCGIGAASDSGTMWGIGIVLAIVSAILNGINSKLME